MLIHSQEIFSKTVVWKITYENDILNKFQKDLLNFKGWETKYIEKIKSGNDIWSLIDLGLLFESLTYNMKYLRLNDAYKSYFPWINKIKSIFQSEIADSNYNIAQKSIIIFMFVKGFMNFDNQSVTDAQTMLDNLWEEIDSNIKIEPYKHIFGALYAIIGSKLFYLSSEFLTRRNLVGALISKYFNPNLFDKKFWTELMIESHPYIFGVICDGISSLIQMVLDHAKELPISDIRNQLLETAQFYSELIIDLILSYFSNNFDIQLDEDVNEFIEYLDKMPLYPFIKYNIKKCMITSIKSQILLQPSKFDKDTILLILGLELIDNIEGKIPKSLYQIDFWLLTGSYPFELIIQEIAKETTQQFSIILSTSFEIEIIRTINHLLDYLTKKYHKTNKIDIEAFEIITYFTGEWLQLFSTSKLLFQEALMVLSAIITICFSQITRGYYEINQVEKAFLSYLNMLYFLDYSGAKIKMLSDISQDDPDKDKNKNISRKFKEIISDLNLSNLLKSDQIKNIATSFETSVIKQTGLTNENDPTLMGMLPEEIVFGYLDSIQDLEDFVLQESSSSSISPLDMDLSSLYYAPESESFIRFERIGSICAKLSKKELPFPLIRNIDELGIALSIFPLKVKLPDSFYEKSLFKSINDILSYD